MLLDTAKYCMLGYYLLIYFIMYKPAQLNLLADVFNIQRSSYSLYFMSHAQYFYWQFYSNKLTYFVILQFVDWLNCNLWWKISKFTLKRKVALNKVLQPNIKSKGSSSSRPLVYSSSLPIGGAKISESQRMRGAKIR